MCEQANLSKAGSGCTMRRAFLLAACAVLACALAVASWGCANSSPDSKGETSGPAYTCPETALSPYCPEGLQGTPDAGIDVSGVSQGYVCAVGSGSAPLKAQVQSGEASYAYDIPADETPVVAPLNMGSGLYTFRIMQNTTSNRYVEIFSTTADVALESECAPYLRPNVYCAYTDQSLCVQKARELAASASNQGDVLRAVYAYIRENVAYDAEKAAALSGQAGYVPDPDETFKSGLGICFDYASLAAAMLRSVGIPCKIVTGSVSPDGVHHAWNMVYLDGSWHAAEISVDAGSWTLVDLTFAAAGTANASFVGDGATYTPAYEY